MTVPSDLFKKYTVTFCAYVHEKGDAISFEWSIVHLNLIFKMRAKVALFYLFLIHCAVSHFICNED